MRAVVLSGGGNRGALQVGALQAMFEAGIVPDMIVGASVGAINGACVAFDPTLQGVETLGRIWRHVTREDLYPGNNLTALWSIVSGRESLFSNGNWYRFLQRHMPCDSFDGLGTRCYVVATELESGQLHIFGDDPRDSLLDALMASCALPPLHPPYEVDGHLYIDGGATANLPLRIAMERGATEIYALSIWGGLPTGRARNILDISTRAVGAILQRQITQDIEHCISCPDVRVHQIDLMYDPDLEPWDFSKTEEMIAVGYQAAQPVLARPVARMPTWQERLTEHRDRLVESLGEATANLGTLLWPKEAATQQAPARGGPSVGD